MRKGILAFQFLLLAVALWANPFIGNWKANDTFKVTVSDTVVTVTVDDQEKVGVGDYSYTYDDSVIRVGTTVLVYDLPNGHMIGLLGFLKGTPTFIILELDNSSSFVPKREMMD